MKLSYLIFLFFSSNAIADDQTNTFSFIDAEYVSVVSSNLVKSQGTRAIEQLFKNLNFSVDHLSMGNDPSVELNQIQLQIQAPQHTVVADEDGVYFQSFGHAFRVELGSIGIHQTIQKNVGGVILNLRVDTSCDGVSVQIVDESSIISGHLSVVQSGEYLGLKLTQSQVEFTNPQFSFSSLKCTGADGFDDVIRSTIQSTLQDPKFLSQFVQSNIISNLEQTLNKMSYKWSDPQSLFSGPSIGGMPGVKAWLYPMALQQRSDGSWLSHGTVRFVLPFDSGVLNQRIPLTDFSESALEGQIS